VPTKRAIDWRGIGATLMTPEVLGAIIGGAGAPLATYLVRRKKEMPKWQRIAELLGAGVLGAGVGAGIGYGGKKLMSTFSPPPAIRPPDDKPTTMPEQDEQEQIEPGFNRPYVDKYLKSVKGLIRELNDPERSPLRYWNYVNEVEKGTTDLLWAYVREYENPPAEWQEVVAYLHDELSKIRNEMVKGTKWEHVDRDLTDMLRGLQRAGYRLQRVHPDDWLRRHPPARLFESD